MEKLSPKYLSEGARVDIRALYSGRNDKGLWDYACEIKRVTKTGGARPLLGRMRLGISRLMLRVLDGVSDEVLHRVNEVVNLDVGKVGKFNSI